MKLCWGKTIHKSQGLTLPNAIIYIGAKENVAGLVYVAISRVGKLSDLIIEPTTSDRLNAVKKIKKFQYSLDEETRLGEICNHKIYIYTYSPRSYNLYYVSTFQLLIFWCIIVAKQLRHCLMGFLFFLQSIKVLFRS